MSLREWCKHYRALSEYETCKAGIVMKDVMASIDKWPCVIPAHKSMCTSWEPYPEEKIKAHEAKVAEFVNTLNAFDERRTEDCPHCGKHVNSLRQVGRCVYALPCNCRIWQGTVPEAWK